MPNFAECSAASFSWNLAVSQSMTFGNAGRVVSNRHMSDTDTYSYHIVPQSLGDTMGRGLHSLFLEVNLNCI